MSKCPYHNTDKAAETPAQPAAAEAPVVAPHPVPAGSEAAQCPYMRKKQQEQAAQQQGQQQPANPESRDWTTATPAEFKEHFKNAYNDVAAATANKTFRSDIAAVLVAKLGYTEEEIKIIGNDVALMQGTGNPHVLAKLVPGEKVVDLGSGFGIDAVLAASRVGSAGRVIGIDLSVKEIANALQRVSDRKLRNVDFRLGDIEDMPVEDGFADAVISNGGFCLVPDKPKAFREVYRVLRPGGRFSVSCTVRLRPLDPTKHWPSCMVVFMPLDTVHEVLTTIGFTDIVVDDSNSRTDLWDSTNPTGHGTTNAAAKPAEEPATAAATADDAGDNVKVTIHKGDAQFDHLKSLDMNQWFARVNIYARKP